MSDPRETALDPEVLLLLRDRFLLALLEPEKPGGTAPALLDLRRPEVAMVRAFANGQPIVLLTWHPAFGSEGDLADRISRSMGMLGRGTMHVVAVGGGEEVQEVLRNAAPKVGVVRRFTFSQLGADGVLRAVHGGGLPLLGKAAARMAAQPADAAGVEQRLADLERVARDELAQEREFAQRLGSGRPAAAIGISVVCGLLFVLQSLWGRDYPHLALFRMGAGNGELVRQGEVWRLLSAAFLHVGIAHIVMNLSALFALGPMLERLFGWRRFLLLYGLSALGGASASALLAPQVASAGASGAIWGLMGAGFGLALRPRGVLPPRTRARMRSGLVSAVMINGIISFLPGVDMWAHFGGGLAGFLLVFSGALHVDLAPIVAADSGFEPAPQVAARRTTLADVLGLVFGALMIAAVAVALWQGRPWELTAGPQARRVTLGEGPLSLEVPASLAAHEPESSGQSRVYGWGNLMRDPMAVQVFVADLGEDVGDELDLALAQAGVALNSNRIDGSRVVKAPHEKQVGDRRAMVTEDETGNGIRLRRYAMFEGRWHFVVTTFVPGATAGAWEAAEPKVAESVRVAP